MYIAMNDLNAIAPITTVGRRRQQRLSQFSVPGTAWQKSQQQFLRAVGYSYVAVYDL